MMITSLMHEQQTK